MSQVASRFWNIALLLGLAAGLILLPWSVKGCHAGLFVFLLAWVGEGQWLRKVELLRANPIVIPYMAFFVIHLAGVFYSEDVAYAWFNIEKKMLFFLLPPALLSCASLRHDQVRALLMAFLISCFAVTVVCIHTALALPHGGGGINFDPLNLERYEELNRGSAFWWLQMSYIQLASAIDIHPTFLSIYLIFCVLIAIDLSGRPEARRLSGFRWLVVSIAVYFTLFTFMLSSRMATLSFLGILPFALRHAAGNWKWAAVSTLIAITLFIFTILVNPVARYRYAQEPTRLESYEAGQDSLFAYSMGIRLSLWRAALEAVRKHPIAGVGTGDVSEAMRGASEELSLGNILGTTDPHNQYLHTWLGLGLPGLLTLAACLLLPAWSAYRKKDFLQLWQLVLFSLLCLTASALEVQKGVAFFSLINSLFLFRNRTESAT